MEVRLSQEDKKRVRLAAALLGQSMNQFVVSWLLQRSDEILEKNESILCAF